MILICATLVLPMLSSSCMPTYYFTKNIKLKKIKLIFLFSCKVSLYIWDSYPHNGHINQTFSPMPFTLPNIQYCQTFISIFEGITNGIDLLHFLSK